jgi:hypothetical protein
MGNADHYNAYNHGEIRIKGPSSLMQLPGRSGTVGLAGKKPAFCFENLPDSGCVVE